MSKQLNIDQLFQKAKTQPVARSFEKTKNEFLKHLSAEGKTPPTDGKGSFFTLKNLIIMISSIFTVSVAAIFLFPTEEHKKSAKKVAETVQTKNEITKIEFLIEEEEIPKNKEFVWPIMETKSLQAIHSFVPKELLTPIVIQRKEKTSSNSPVYNNYKYYPKLTPEEIAANHKQKKKMVKALVKVDNKQYSFARSGSFTYQGETVSVQAFFIQQNEVTNLEYRTFLFDLLIQGKKDEFDIAKPAQENWTILFGEGLKSMQDQYFSHEAFNEYPVCNVSRAGAEMYCVWLTKAANSTLNEGEKINDVRIPTRTEWIFAASSEGKNLPFPWTGSKITNESGCYLTNFDAKSVKNDVNSIDSISVDGALLTAKTRTYNPSGGMYNLSGNVAEMVYNSERDFPIKNTNKTIKSPDPMDKSNPGTAGGSWLNSEEEIKINGPDPYDGVTEGHPGIGFRVVVTHLAK